MSQVAQKKWTQKELVKDENWVSQGKQCKKVDLTPFGHNIQSAILTSIASTYGDKAANFMIKRFKIHGVLPKVIS